MRPTTLKWPAPAIPATSVAKISGAMIILIRFRKIVLNGWKYFAIASARAGSFSVTT